MTQIPPGTLRAYLDDDPVLDAAARAHVAATVATDPATDAALDVLRAERAIVQSVFSPLVPPTLDNAAVEQAYRRARARAEAAPRRGTLAAWWGGMVAALTPRAARVRGVALGGAAVTFGVVALALLITFAPVGSLVSATLDQFRYQPEKFAVITLRAGDLTALSGGTGAQDTGNAGAAPFAGARGAAGTKPAGLPTIPAGGAVAGGATTLPTLGGGTTGTAGMGAFDPAALGGLSQYVALTTSLGQGKLPAHPVLSANAAQLATGRAPSVAGYLPDGVTNKPLYLVSDAQTADATIDVKSLRPALAGAGADGFLPPGADSATVHLTLPAATITSYGFNVLTVASAGASGVTGQRGVIVASLATPSVEVQGVDVRALASGIASLPGVPPALAGQLRSADLSRTLVLPVTDEQIVKNGTFIGGSPSTLIAQRDGSSAVVLWFKGGILYVVAGTFDGETMQRVAQSVK